jgi:hypothetical protein
MTRLYRLTAARRETARPKRITADDRERFGFD